MIYKKIWHSVRQEISQPHRHKDHNALFEYR